ncbi:hypothetical protein [Lacisediminihabitans changchengi]|uniref:Uncharacterized protein n=1 Tax=Lacisediminihabitans changchengi TaxID=2787634 RepID=A0A934W451_9MICO|nr:hypothetical protein [Lacisediminihabitans changchengi]MBK4348586.1 hypothetical protein [Lacisediminihabitans changchengi]
MTDSDNSAAPPPRLGRRVLRWGLAAVRPLLAKSYIAGAPTRLAAGIPDDAPHGLIEGPNTLNVLVVGGLSGSALGVHSNRLGVAHQLAHRLHELTGRGVEWEALAQPKLRLAATGESLRGLRGLASYDLIVLSPGITDLLSFVPIAAWRRDFERLVWFLDATMAPGARLFVTEVPDVSRYVQAGSFVSGVLIQDARELSTIAAEVCSSLPRAQCITLPEISADDFADGVFEYATLYRRWGRYLAEQQLQEET